MGGGTLKKADLHIVGCDVDSLTVRDLAIVPFRALDSGQFGFRIHGWKDEKLILSLRDEPDYYARPVERGQLQATELWETYALDWGAHMSEVPALPADLERYVTEIDGYEAFDFESKNPELLKVGPNLRYMWERRDVDTAIAVMTEHDSEWRWLLLLKGREGVVVPLPEARPN
jgi:hypothetical protein